MLREEITRDVPFKIDVIFEVLCTDQSQGTKSIIILQSIFCLSMIFIVRLLVKHYRKSHAKRCKDHSDAFDHYDTIVKIIGESDFLGSFLFDFISLNIFINLILCQEILVWCVRPWIFDRFFIIRVLVCNPAVSLLRTFYFIAQTTKFRNKIAYLGWETILYLLDTSSLFRLLVTSS